MPTGLSSSFHIDQADLQQKFNAYSNCPIEIGYREFYRIVEDEKRKFAAVYIPPSKCILKPIKKGTYMLQTGKNKGKEKTAFKENDVLFRRGTQSILASKKELEWIKKRAEREEYKLSILSGQPDKVSEEIYSNLFEVVRLPSKIYSAFPTDRFFSAKNYGTFNQAVYLRWRSRVITFHDITNSESVLREYVQVESIQSESVSEWLCDNNKKRILIRLLNKELSFFASSINLMEEIQVKYDRKIRKHKFYFPCFAEKRTETWKPRYKQTASRLVAQRIWAKQFNQFVYWHTAVKAQFIFIDEKLFLRLNPTLIITSNGKRAIAGVSVVTRLVYNRYNVSYLNSLLFWISRFAKEKECIELANGKIAISGKPVISKMKVGILFDRPASEFVEEPLEIKILEE
jgi:hypothetical protein